MLENSKYPIKITTSGYEVIASGTVHLVNPEVTFNIANLVIKYLFKTDADTTRLTANIVGTELVIDLYNFNNALGQGQVEPIEIGTLEGKKLFTTFFINTPKGDIRQFHYTFMMRGV